MSKLNEECGVFAICNGNDDTDVASSVFLGLFALQHRGQEGAGISINRQGKLYIEKELGLVSDVFTKSRLSKLADADMAIGHVRYSTTGSSIRANVQPLLINHLKGNLSLAHNGNLTNASYLRELLENEGCIFHTSSDTEVIAYLITRNRMTCDSIESAISKTMETIKGAYSLVLMTKDKIVAARDPYGFRPLCLGKLNDRYVLTSESCALDAIKATFIRDIKPGEIVSIKGDKITSDETHCNKVPKALCVFELIYFARPDSKLDGISVHNSRVRAGSILAIENPIQADIVIGVPDSGIDAAIGYSRQSGIPYEVGLIKNKYIGRTFIEPLQEGREKSVSIKLNTVKSVIKGKRVVLVDDSIVRGTTSKQLVKLLRESGAKEVHFLSSAPKFLYPCYFGTDIDSSENLIAYKYTDEEMKEILNVDSIGFLSVNAVKKIGDVKCEGFCTACFSGDYPYKIDSDNKKERFDLNE